MTINKNFVVRNGLEVAQTLLCADDETNRVGINSANPEFELDLYGDLRITGGLSVGGTTGRPGEYLESTGGALEWKAIPVLRVVETYTAVSGQVTFPSTGFLPYAAADFIDVFVDGVKLSQDEYTTTTGNTRIELVAPAFSGETVELVAYNASSIGVGGSGIQGITIGEEGVVVGTAGQVTNLNFVGASLTAIGSGAGVTVYFDNVVPGIATYASFSGVATYASSSGIASALISTASVNTTGIITASKFVGDGSGLTGISGGTSSQWVTTAAGIHTTSNVGIGTTIAGEKLQVDGNIRLGVSTNSNYIAFRGTTFDGPGNTGGELPYQHTYIGERIYDYSGTGERSELLLFKGNDIADGISGPDRIRLFAGEHRFDVLGIKTAGTFEEVGSSTAAVNAVTINTTGVGIGTTNVTSKLTVQGDVRVSGVVTAASFGSINGTQLNVSGVSTFNANVYANNHITVASGYGLYVNNIAGSYHQLGGSPNYDLLLFKSRGSGPISDVSINILNDTLNTGGGSDESVFKVYGDGGLRSYYHTISGGFAIQSERFSVTGGDSSGSTATEVVMKVGSGVTVYGNSGIVSATSFYGTNFYGTFNGNLTGSIANATNLTGGTANASSLNVLGIATISAGRIQVDASSNIRLGNLPAGSGSGRNIAIGDQVLFSLSGGSGRNIGIGELSYYDTTTGQYNIGIGERAGQKVTTGAYNVILGAYDGNSGNLDIRTSSNNVVIADGQGNIRQYINSSGNVGIKTTVVTEALTVAGVVSATSFYGTLNAGQLTGSLPAIDGSALIGVVGSGSGVIIQDDGTPIGTAGTINFGSNLSVSFASGIATVSSSIAGISTSGTSTFNELNATNLSVSGVSTFTNSINLNSGNLKVATNGIIKVGNSDELEIYYNGATGQTIKSTGSLSIFTSRLLINNAANSEQLIEANENGSVDLYYDNSKKFETLGTGVTVTGTTFTNQLVSSGVVTASSFSGSGANLTNLPAGQLTGSLPAIDGSALLNVTAAGTGVVVEDDQVNVGSATTIDFGTGLDVSFSGGVATITASGGSLQSRTIVTGVTTSIANNGIGNTNITGFKSYALMKVGLSTAGWLRLYTDSTSRDNDASRSVGIDPAPGSGVIAEVVTTGISTTQIISPFVMGGNLDNPADTTIYAAITNLSGSTQAITANLTILQLEA